MSTVTLTAQSPVTSTLLHSQNAGKNIDRFRQLVPVAEKSGYTYLNASFQPPMNLVVRSAIQSFLDEAAFDLHPKPTWQSRAEELRTLVAKYINAPAESIAFTRDTTEGLNLFQRSLDLEPGDNVIVLDSEHPNHVCAWMALRERGLEVRQVPTGNTFHADATTFEPFVDSRTRAIGISSCMFHSGQRNNIADICARYRPRGIHVLVDMTQEVGFGVVDVQRYGASAAAFSFHKGLSCPTGLGALYVDPSVVGRLKTPPIVGAGSITNLNSDLTVSSDALIFHASARRFEHLNVSLIAIHAARASLQFLLQEVGPENLEAHLRSLGKRLRTGCKELGVPTVAAEEESKRAPHITVLALKDPRWMAHLEENRVKVSVYRLGIRVSTGFYNNNGDVDRLLEVLRSGKAAGIPLS